MDEKEQFILVKSKALPKTYMKVLKAKEILAAGNSISLSEACKRACISRSVFYKYKENVFTYQQLKKDQVFTLQIKLLNKPGLLSKLLRCLYKNNSDILTVNQNIPNTSFANVTVSIISQKDKSVHINKIIMSLSEIDGVNCVEMV